MKTDFTKKEKRICVIVSLIISSLLFWGYSLIFPIVPKIEKIQNFLIENPVFTLFILFVSIISIMIIRKIK